MSQLATDIFDEICNGGTEGTVFGDATIGWQEYDGATWIRCFPSFRPEDVEPTVAKFAAHQLDEQRAARTAAVPSEPVFGSTMSTTVLATTSSPSQQLPPSLHQVAPVVPSCSPEVAPVPSERVPPQHWAHGVSSDTAQA